MSTKNKIEIGIFRFFKLFSRMWKTGEIYKADKIGRELSLAPHQCQYWKDEKKNCSSNTAFSYLLDNLRRIRWLWYEFQSFSE